MADTMEVVDRDYSDNYAAKEAIVEELIPKYFPDLKDLSLRTAGLTGMVSEVTTHISEDVFNTVSILFRELFPNRAMLSESIYSHAAIFGLETDFSSAAACRFILVMDETKVIENAEPTLNRDTGIMTFYIGRNTTIYIEDIPFTLDYPIKIEIVNKRNSTGKAEYIFTATYMKDDVYHNSISQVQGKYVKLRRSSERFMALEVDCHQCQRRVIEDQIVSNSVINYPIKEYTFDGQLAGFDVLYRSPYSDQYVNLEKLLVYSTPIKTPFCYYQMKDEHTIRITFNTKDGYFQPEYNSELQIVMYLTKGKEGNFTIYEGTDIQVMPDEESYPYASDYLISAQFYTSSSGGKAQNDLEALQALTVEAYRTVNALTTENDLNSYFSNYKYRYGDSTVLPIKKRDDVYERLYGIYMLVKDDDYIYKTNTLSLRLNMSDMKFVEEPVYIIEPGTLFSANEIEIDNANVVSSEKVYTAFAKFIRNEELDEQLYQDYLVAVENGEIPYIPNTTDPTELPQYLRRPASFAEYKRRLGIDTKYTIYDLTEEELATYEDHTAANPKFLYINPFLIRFEKSPNLVTVYMTYINHSSLLDYDAQNSNSYLQFIINQVRLKRNFTQEKKYIITLDLIPSANIDPWHPIWNTELEIDEDTTEDMIFNDYNEHYSDDYYDKNRFLNHLNDLRVFFIMTNNTGKSCYIELTPVGYDRYTENYKYRGEFLTDDFIASNGELRLLEDTIYRFAKDAYERDSSGTIIYRDAEGNDITEAYLEFLNNPEYDEDGNIVNEVVPVPLYYAGEYFKAQENDATKYTHYAEDHTIIEDDVPVNTVTELLLYGDVYKYETVHNLTTAHDIYINTEEVTCEIHTLYHRVFVPSKSYGDGSGTMEEITDSQGNSFFFDLDDPSLKPYIWTNIYSTKSERLHFLKPLNNVRVQAMYEDYTKYTYDEEGNPVYDHELMDLKMLNIPMIKYDIALDEDKIEYFMNTFLAQYNFLIGIVNDRLRTDTSLDVKLYNSYGRSRYFYIGEEDEVINTVNLRLEFDIWYIPGTEFVSASDKVKRFIKSDIETINENGQNFLHISNLIRKIENKFDFVDHLRFKGINRYNTTYQTARNFTTDLNTLTVEQRRWYVPEFLVIDYEDIILNEEYSM